MNPEQITKKKKLTKWIEKTGFSLIEKRFQFFLVYSKQKTIEIRTNLRNEKKKINNIQIDVCNTIWHEVWLLIKCFQCSLLWSRSKINCLTNKLIANFNSCSLGKLFIRNQNIKRTTTTTTNDSNPISVTINILFRFSFHCKTACSWTNLI